MADDPRQKIIHLLSLATSNHDGGENETANAARAVCDILAKNPAILGDRPSGGSSRIHPNAEAERSWRHLVRTNGLHQGPAREERKCASCGNAVERGAAAITHAEDDVVTHRDCGSWWYSYEPENSIPF